MHIRNNEKGQTTVLVVLSMAVLLGFVALAVDVGTLFRARRNLQIVADAAATAGALDYYKNGMGNVGSVASAQTAADNAVLANGLSTTGFSTSCPVSPSGNVPQACVSIPPSSGVHMGTGFVEVQITQPNTTTFMSFFGFNRMNVAARAVGGIVTGQACIWVKNNLNVQGNAGICGINPANPGAWTGNCASGTTCPITGYSACGIYVGGNITGSGGGGGSNCIASSSVATAGTVGVPLNPSPAVAGVTETPPSFLTASPDPPSSPCGTTGLTGITYNNAQNSNFPNVIDATLTGSPTGGCYGIDALPAAQVAAGWTTANTVMNLKLTSAALANGTYTFDLGTYKGGGTLTVGSNVYNQLYAPVAGSTTLPHPDFNSNYPGVTMDLYTGNFSVSSTSTGINLYAPNDGSTDPANGILLWEPGSNTGTINIQWGSSTGNFYGYIVASGATLSMQDQGGFGIVTGLYVGNMTVNSQLGVASYDKTVAGAPGKTIALVE
jgi:hypothetical protein